MSSFTGVTTPTANQHQQQLVGGLLAALGQLACENNVHPQLKGEGERYKNTSSTTPPAPSTSPVPWSTNDLLSPPCEVSPESWTSYSELSSNALPQRPSSAPPPALSPLIVTPQLTPHPPPRPQSSTTQLLLSHHVDCSTRCSTATKHSNTFTSILMAPHLVTNPFRPSCVVNMAAVRPRSPKKVRFHDRLPSRDGRQRCNTLDALSLASISLTKKKSVIRKSKLSFIGTKYSNEKRSNVHSELTNVVADTPKCFNKFPENIQCFSTISRLSPASIPTIKLCIHSEKQINNTSSFLNKNILNFLDSSTLENFSELAVTGDAYPATSRGCPRHDKYAVSALLTDINTTKSGGSCSKQFFSQQYGMKHRTSNVGVNGSINTTSTNSPCSSTNTSKSPSNASSVSSVKSRRMLYKLRERRKKVVADTDLPNLTQLSLVDQPSDHKCSSSSTTAQQCCNGISGQTRSCSQEARDEQHFEDTSLEELAAYIDDYLYFPKKMSLMAEMMYT